MIELRWLERAVKPEHEGATGYYERVLQYREQKGLDMWDRPTWWEWTDVPTAREDG